MSNKPRKKKKPTKKCRPVQASSAFDNYEQYDIAPPKDHDEEIALIYQYLIDKFGDTSTTEFKLHEVLISLAHIAERDGATPY
ncbi:TPA: hypothetical protein ACX6PG_002584 [Photobacterium damselae]